MKHAQLILILTAGIVAVALALLSVGRQPGTPAHTDYDQPLPGRAPLVAASELAAFPSQFHRKRVVLEGIWRRGFEVSTLEVVEGQGFSSGSSFGTRKTSPRRPRTSFSACRRPKKNGARTRARPSGFAPRGASTIDRDPPVAASGISGVPTRCSSSTGFYCCNASTKTAPKERQYPKLLRRPPWSRNPDELVDGKSEVRRIAPPPGHA